MASATEPIERLRQRLKLLYVLVAFLYVGILLNFYVTVSVLHRGQTCLTSCQHEPLKECSCAESNKERSSHVENDQVLADFTHRRSATNVPRNTGDWRKSNDRKSGEYADNTSERKTSSGTARTEGEHRDGSIQIEVNTLGKRVRRREQTNKQKQTVDQWREISENDFDDFASPAPADSDLNFYLQTREFRDDNSVPPAVKPLDVRSFDSRDVSENLTHIRKHQSQERSFHRGKRSTWGNRRRTRQYSSDSRPSVDFYDKPQTKQDGDDEYVWLTSYSRIPIEILEEYCVALKERCPPGEKGAPGLSGSPGLRGDRGERGDRGLPGEIGLRGPQGFHGVTGPVGPKGEKGLKGQQGLDGRDGIPGEPGLDGVPGRDGIDGIPGRDGIPGIPGTPGRSGANGTDGIPGLPGPKGLQGPPGPVGLPGPRGRRGSGGAPGSDGTPGITAWLANNTRNGSILMAPSIAEKDKQTTLIVDEGRNVRLRCIAAGNPPPKISWTRTDRRSIDQKWLQQSAVPDVLDIPSVTREKAGNYRCTADNGIPQKDTMDIKLEVAFPPLIKIRNQSIGTVNGSYAYLECIVDAHPAALNFWLHGDNRLVESSSKYRTKQKEDGYTTVMSLNITNIVSADYGHYKCVSKNDRGKTQGVFNVFETDPNIPTPIPTAESSYEVYGQLPPMSKLDENDCEACITLCDPPPACPTGGQPHSTKVYTAYVPSTLYLPPPKPRRDNCMIHQLGKPVFQRSSKDEQGSWYQDPVPTPENEHKYYVTLLSDPYYLYEYSNRENFRNDNHSVKHDLTKEIAGNAHAIYNGSFYFHEGRNNVLIKYDIARNSTVGKPIPDLDRRNYLYSTDMNYMDIAVDENGLWVIYSSIYSNYTVVSKLDSYSLKTSYTWNITFQHRTVGDMFICCGVLYGVNSATAPNTQITFAFDLYQKRVLDVDIAFSNPFRQSSMISYNPRYKKIFSWDKGNQLTYPILFGTIDTDPPEE